MVERRHGDLISLQVRLYMVDHVAHLARFEVASVTAQKLVCSASCLVNHKALGEAHVARVRAEPIPHTALGNNFLERSLLSVKATLVSIESVISFSH